MFPDRIMIVSAPDERREQWHLSFWGWEAASTLRRRNAECHLQPTSVVSFSATAASRGEDWRGRSSFVLQACFYDARQTSNGGLDWKERLQVWPRFGDTQNRNTGTTVRGSEFETRDRMQARVRRGVFASKHAAASLATPDDQAQPRNGSWRRLRD